MPVTEEVETTDAEEETTDEILEEEESTDTEATVEDADSGLKKALAAERKAHRDSERRAKALEQQLADKDKPADEVALDTARREAREEAMKAANERVIRSEVKAAATGKIKNPAIALKLIDTSEIEVGEDGEIDASQIDDAITALLEEYPELAADGRKFGNADQGAERKSAKTPQMTQSEFDQIKSNPHAVMKAKTEGRLNALLGIET